MGNMGWAGAARTMIQSLHKKQSLDRKRRCNMMPWSCLIMGTCAPSCPPSPSPRSPSPAPLSLQRIVEDDVSGGGNALVGVVYRGQGRQLGGRAIQTVVGGGAIVGGGGGGGGGRAGVHRTVKHANYKRWGWDRSSNVWTLFEVEVAKLFLNVQKLGIP